MRVMEQKWRDTLMQSGQRWLFPHAKSSHTTAPQNRTQIILTFHKDDVCHFSYHIDVCSSVKVSS